MAVNNPPTGKRYPKKTVVGIKHDVSTDVERADTRTHLQSCLTREPFNTTVASIQIGK